MPHSSARNDRRGACVRAVLALLVLFLAASLPACVGDEGDVPKILRRARDAMNAGLWLEAENRYETFLQGYPDNPHRWEAWESLLNVAQTVRGDQDKALAIMETMLLEFADQPRRTASLLLRMGDASLAQRRPAKAVEYWQRGLSLSDLPPGDIWPFTLRPGRTWRVMKEYSASRDVLEECVELAPSAAAVGNCRIELGMTLGFLQSWEEAAAVLDNVVGDPEVRDEDRGVAGMLLADALLHLDQTEKAREVLEAVRSLHPNPKAVDAILNGLTKK